MNWMRFILATLLSWGGLSAASSAELANGVGAVVDDSAITLGEVEADAGTETGITIVTLDPDAVRKARGRIPAWRGSDSAPLKVENSVAS